MSAGSSLNYGSEENNVSAVAKSECIGEMENREVNADLEDPKHAMKNQSEGEAIRI